MKSNYIGLSGYRVHRVERVGKVCQIQASYYHKPAGCPRCGGRRLVSKGPYHRKPRAPFGAELPRPNAYNFLRLPVIAGQQTSQGQVLVQIRPMDPEGRYLHPIQLLRRAWRKSTVPGYRKPDLLPALHHDDDLAISVDGRLRTIGQSSHATHV